MAGSTGAIRAGRAFVELYADDSRLVAGLRGASAKLKAWGSAISGMGAQMMAGGAAILGPLLASVKVFASTGDALDEMSARTGASVEFLSGLGYAAELSGSSLAGMEVSIRRLQRSAYDATTGSKSAADAFAALGVSVKGADGQLKSTEQLFEETAVALSGVENETKKAALATVLFGRAGTRILPMLQGGAKGYAAAMAEAKRLGIVMSGANVAAAVKLADAMDRVKAVLKRVMLEVGAAIAGPLAEMESSILETAQRMIEWIRANQETIVSVAKLAATAVIAGAAIMVLGSTLSALGNILRSLATVLPLVATPIGLLVVGLVAAGLVFRQVTRYAADLRSEMQDLRAAGDQLRAADQQRFGRLQELAGQQDLSNTQMDEAAKIIEVLEGRYGALNMRLDRVAGSLAIGTDAMNGFNAAMRNVAIAETMAELAELDRNRLELMHEYETWWTSAKEMVNFNVAGPFQRNMAVVWKQIEAAQLRLRAIQGGDTATALGSPPGGSPGLLGGDTGDDAAKMNREFQQKLTDLQIAGIRDEEVRAKAAIDERWSRELAAAIKAGADLETLQKAWDLERLNSATDFANRRADAEKQAKERSAKESQSLDREVARARIEATLTGRAKEEALLTQEWEERRQDAIEAGTGTGRIDELWDLKKAALDKQDFGGAVKAGFSVGTFGKFALGGLGMGGGPAERTAKATEKTVEHLEFIRRRFTFTGPETSAKFAS